MSDSIWHELGIEPTTELGAIKRAYAARLKVTRPDQDAASFARLRSAYEAASAFADRPRQAPAQQPEAVQSAEAETAQPLPLDRTSAAPVAQPPQQPDAFEAAVLRAISA